MRLAALLLALSSTVLAAPGVVPGEAFTFRFTVGPIEGARARMSVGLPATKDGRTLVAVQGEAETLSIAKLLAPISASYVLTLDTATLLPKDVTSVERGLHDVTYTHHYTGKELQLDLVAKAKEHHGKHVLSRETRDPISSYFALRAMDLVPEKTLTLDVLDGAVLWRAHLRVVGSEDLQMSDDTEHPHPPVRAIHLEGKLEHIDWSGRPLGRAPRTVSVFLSDDDKRLLYRCSFDSELGRAKLDLTSYIPPPRSKKLPAGSLPLPGITIE
jgi:hypothetical protein